MKDLRERCEKLYVDLYSYKHPPQDEGMIREFESFALQIRNEALLDALITVQLVATSPPGKGLGAETNQAVQHAANRIKELIDTATLAAKGSEK